MSRFRVTAAAAALLLAAPLAACGGGGSGGAGGGTVTPPPPSPPPPPPPPPPVPGTPSVTSTEYLLNPGVGMVNAETAWAAGATGAGVTVAVIDSGVKSGTHDLEGRLSSDSTDIVGTRNQPYASRDTHGTMVAGVIAANFNNRGTVGVAYQATILSIRTDEIGPCGGDPGAAPDNDCGFLGGDVAAALDYATSHGARVSNLSMGGDSPSGTATRNALGRAVTAGQVIVIAAGNAEDGAAPAPDPGWPARFAADPAFNGQIIAVGALNAAGNDIASFSYRAGVAQNYYLLAPGEDIVSACGLPSTSDPGQVVCYRGSGTSFATPHVSGAAALLFDGFPNLSAREVADILLRSARDMGAPGVDAIYGRGALDIDRAFQPLGTLSVPTSQGLAVIGDDAGPSAAASAAFGDALLDSPALATVGYDDYQRLFNVDLGAAYRRDSARNLAAGGLPAISRVGVQVTTPDGAEFRIASLRHENLDRPEGAVGLQERTDGPIDITASYANGGLRLDLWSGRSGVEPVFDGAEPDAFSRLAGAEQRGRAAFSLGRWMLSAEQGQGRRSLDETFDQAGALRAEREASSRYARLMANFRNEYLSTTFGVGRLDERGGPLGAFAQPGSGLSIPAVSRFASLQTQWTPAPGLQVIVQGAIGRTEAQGPILSISDATSSSWSFRTVADCSLFRLACSGLSFEIAQPVRIERGQATAYLADRPENYFDDLTYSARRLSLSPSGRELDLRASAWAPLGAGALRVEASALVEEGHRQDSPINLGLSAGWRARF